MGLCSLIPYKTYMYNSLMQNKIISSTETNDSHQCFETMDIAGINKRSLSIHQDVILSDRRYALQELDR